MPGNSEKAARYLIYHKKRFISGLAKLFYCYFPKLGKIHFLRDFSYFTWELIFSFYSAGTATPQTKHLPSFFCPFLSVHDIHCTNKAKSVYNA